MLLEQLKEAELLCGTQQLRDAEESFEDARQQLRLSRRCLSEDAPKMSVYVSLEVVNKSNK